MQAIAAVFVCLVGVTVASYYDGGEYESLGHGGERYRVIEHAVEGHEEAKAHEGIQHGVVKHGVVKHVGVEYGGGKHVGGNHGHGHGGKEHGLLGHGHDWDKAHYSFLYGVKDPHTKDVHSQHEHRKGHHVTGGYALNEPDGTKRIVKYKSGPHSGFEATVARIGLAKHPAIYGGHGGYDYKGHKGHKAHGGEGHAEHAGEGGTSYVGVIHWGNQGHEEEGHGYGHGDVHDYGHEHGYGHGDKYGH